MWSLNVCLHACILSSILLCNLYERHEVLHQASFLSVYVCVVSRQFSGSNVSVNVYPVNEPWLYSLMWCSGVQSVSSDAPHILKKVPNPTWILVLISLWLNPSSHTPIMCKKYILCWPCSSTHLKAGQFSTDLERLSFIKSYTLAGCSFNG